MKSVAFAAVILAFGGVAQAAAMPTTKAGLEKCMAAALKAKGGSIVKLEFKKEDDDGYIYEFDIEVRPEFDLPSYKGLKLRKPVHTYNEAEKAREKKRLLEPYGQLAPKEGDSPSVELDDYVSADVTIKLGDNELLFIDSSNLYRWFQTEFTG